MATNQCIQHEKEPIAMVRTDYRAICHDAPDPNCAAALLNYFEYWTNRKLDKRESLWIFQSQAKIKSDLFDMFSRNKIRDALVYLEATKHFIQSRHNPSKKWDRTLQYLFEIETVKTALSARAVPLSQSGQSIVPDETIESSAQDDPLSQPGQAIPKSTSKNSTKRKRDSLPQTEKDQIPDNLTVLEHERSDPQTSLTDEQEERWGWAYSQLETQFDVSTFDRWIKDIQPLRVEGNQWVVACATQAQKDMLSFRLNRNVQRMLRDCTGNERLEITYDVQPDMFRKAPLWGGEVKMYNNVNQEAS